MKREKYEKKLKENFWLKRFYDTQRKIIEKIFDSQRVLLIEKTWYGKSLCYQFPATQFSGTTIVFSPLIALMRDQVIKLQEKWIAAEYINYQQTQEEQEEIFEKLVTGKVKILYISPERIDNDMWRENFKKINISFIVVDEAHCISVRWHDFRPHYRRIVEIVKLLPDNTPVLAVTATATKDVEEDIKKQLWEDKVTSVRGSLMRKNLKLSVQRCNSFEEKFLWLGNNVNNFKGNGIIYTWTVKDTMIYSKWLNYIWIPSVYYNGRMKGEEKQIIEKWLMNNEWKCIVSTNALWMWMDKSDLRFIIHTQIPQSPVHYYQELGRAGRDGEISDIILLRNEKEDIELPMSFINGSKPPMHEYEKVINILKKQRLGLVAIVKELNLKKTAVENILNDLVDQKIIIRNLKDKKYEYVHGAQDFDSSSFHRLRQKKLEELDKIIKYTENSVCRMQYLCDYLGDTGASICGICDICAQKSSTKEDIMTIQMVENFFDNFFPEIETEEKDWIMTKGYAASFYWISNVGAMIHKSKYNNWWDFPDILVQKVINAYREFGKISPDIVLFVPPTESWDLVKNFAEKVAKRLQIPIEYGIIKTRKTDPQKIFKTDYLKLSNVKNAFSYAWESLEGKSILLIDDIFDSGKTLKEIGMLLKKNWAKIVYPLVIAKAVSADI